MRYLRIFFLFAWAGIPTFTQTISGAYDQPYRPQYHFSPREHWTNDPNGLVYFEGEYHLFFQYNPFGDEWGHMSWGHAVSRDLLSWQELPVALPEQNGIMIFTGSTVIDERNTSGFCSGGKPCMVAVYTGHTPENDSRPPLQTQNLAYSNDRGRTWTKYRGNPILDLHMSDFRDPKVFWSRQGNRWVMAVSLPNDRRVRLYGSKDLKQWQQLSDFGPAGAIDGQWECPELFELPVDGNPAESRWVLKVGLNPGALQGGSGEQYFVGHFDGTRFTNENRRGLTLWTDYGKDCYCALTFNGLPRNQNPVMIGWMDNWQYAAKLPTSPWRGQMTIPRKLSLRTTPEGIRLFQEHVKLPLAVSSAITNGTVEQINKRVAHSDITAGHTFELESSIALGTAQEVGWKILAGNGNFTTVGYEQRKQALFVDRTHSGLTGFSKDFPAFMETPLTLYGGTLHLDILVDRDSVEVFAEGGRIAMTNLVFSPPGASGLEIYATDGNPGRMSARLSAIRSTHVEENMTKSTARVIHLLQNARQNAQAHGAHYSPILSPSDDLLKGANPQIDFKAVQKAGFRVVVWTVDDPARMRELIEQRIDGIISDRPDLLHEALTLAKQTAKGQADARYFETFDAEGHRGGRDLRPENTLPAFEAGLDHLITTIETDTGVTADHVSLISHEHFINPQTCRSADGSEYTSANRVSIKDITMADAQKRFICDRVFRGQLQKNDLALSPVAVAFAKEKNLISPYVPTNVQQLYAFVDFYAAYYKQGPGRAQPDAEARWRNAEKVRFNLETKVDPRQQYANDTFGPELFVRTLCGAVSVSHRESRSDIQSFDFRTLLLTGRQYPKIPTVFLVEAWNMNDEFIPAEFGGSLRK